MSPPKIKIAFQGGGAKFLAMLPVAHAFCACEKGEKIAISAVAGTSAGAICAALLAADCDFDKLREYVKNQGKTHLNRLIPPDTVKIAERIQAGNIKVLDVYQSRNTISSIFKEGMPILREPEFGAFLDKILTFCSRGDEKIESLPKKLSVTATNLANSCGVTFTSGSIKKAVRDSCALPLLLRSFNYLSINHHVDGGLCNNLPVNCLLDDVSAPTFAVFAEETLDPTPSSNIILYLLSLFAASINHNDQRSKGLIYDAYQIPVKTNFSTFSFSKALDVFGDDTWYEKEYTRAYDKIVDFVTSYGEVHNERQFRFIDTKNISDYVNSLEYAIKDYGDFIKHKYAGLIVRVNCADKLDRNKSNLRRLADNVRKTSRFEVTDKRFRYYRSAVSLAGGISAVPTIWHAFNKTKDKDLLIRVLALDSIVGFAQSHKSCVVEFLESEDNIEVGDLIEISSTYYHKDAMIKLNFGMSDSIGASNPHSVSLETVECILSYPKRLGELSIEYQFEESDLPKDRVVKLPVNRQWEYEEIGVYATGVGPGKWLRCKIFY